MSNTTKPKTAIGSVLSQLTKPGMLEASAVKPLKKRSLQDRNVEDFDFLSINERQHAIKNGEIIELDTNKCTLWKLKDRHKNDLGDIESLAKDIELNGQAQPGIVRIIKRDHDIPSFEIIVGERRWEACKLKGLKFLAIVKDLTDREAALLQATENLNRKNLSDYSRGMNYASLIKEGILTQAELQKQLNIPKASLSDLLAFSQIPTIIMTLIEDPTSISAKVASLIRSSSRKGDEYIHAIMSFATNLSSGIGTNKFNQLLNQALSTTKQIEPLSRKVYGSGKRHLFTIKNDGKNLLSISFPKNVSEALSMVDLCDSISKQIESQLLEQ